MLTDKRTSSRTDHDHDAVDRAPAAPPAARRHKPVTLEMLARLRASAEHGARDTGFTIVASDELLALVALADGLHRVLGVARGAVDQPSLPTPAAPRPSRALSIGRPPRQPRREIDVPLVVGKEKYCPDCAGYLPHREFYRNRHASTSMTTYCKFHVNARGAASRAREQYVTTPRPKNLVQPRPPKI